VKRGSQERGSLLRRLLGALGAALTLKTGPGKELTRSSASQDATAGAARAVGAGDAAIPVSTVRAPAVAILIVVAALCCCSMARATDGPPASTSPTPTTPDAPPPDPYKPPAPAAKPKSAPPPRASSPVVHSAPVVQSAPVTRTPSYSPPAVVPVHHATTHRARRVVRAHPRKVVHKSRPRRHVAPRHVASKPVKVNFNPFANLVASSTALATAGADSERGRYLLLAGFAFAVLAAAGLSLHVLSVRMVQ
jgi:hypothetical protein